MAWTTPRTWVTNELVTAAIMNTHVRDNFTYLYNGHAVIEVVDLAAAGDFDFTSIGSTWTHLRIDLHAQGADTTITSERLLVQVNGDSGSNYDYNLRRWIGTTSAPTVETGEASTSGRIAAMPGGNNTVVTNAAAASLFIHNYADPTLRRVLSAQSSAMLSDTISALETALAAVNWRNAADAISRVRLFPSSSSQFGAGSTATLIGYGA